MKRVWDKFLTETDQAIARAGVFGLRAGFGARPVILVIDVTWGVTGHKSEPILESIKRWSISCGENAWKALPAIKALILAGRAKGIPVIYTAGSRFRCDGWDAGSWNWKLGPIVDDSPDAEPVSVDGYAINDEIKPGPRDILIVKHKPSAFHATPLNSFLTLFGADSLIVVGGITSGCVRATVLDAFNENYRVAIIEEGCFDRFEASHAMSLFDLHAKYADVVGIDETLKYLSELRNGLFELPRGARDHSR